MSFSKTRVLLFNKTNYRDIILADDSGKALGKLLRTRLMPIAKSLVLGTQFGGGLNGSETALRICTYT